MRQLLYRKHDIPAKDSGDADWRVFGTFFGTRGCTHPCVLAEKGTYSARGTVHHLLSLQTTVYSLANLHTCTPLQERTRSQTLKREVDEMASKQAIAMAR